VQGGVGEGKPTPDRLGYTISADSETVATTYMPTTTNTITIQNPLSAPVIRWRGTDER
jgi:hypothetical protein